MCGDVDFFRIARYLLPTINQRAIRSLYQISVKMFESLARCIGRCSEIKMSLADKIISASNYSNLMPKIQGFDMVMIQSHHHLPFMHHDNKSKTCKYLQSFKGFVPINYKRINVETPLYKPERLSFKLKTNVIIIVIFQHFILKREQSVTEPDHLPPNGDEVNLNFILHKLNIKVKTNLFTKTVQGVIFARIVTSN